MSRVNFIMPKKKQITVIVLTYKRPNLLAKCLLSLEKQNISRDKFSVLVVDNDVNKSAKHIVNDFQKRDSVDCQYVVEPVKNIALARNRGIENSVGSSYIAFIDDDERADVSWLCVMLETICQHDVDVVNGPVSFCCSEKQTPFVEASDFFTEKENIEGAGDYRVKATNNVLINRRIIDQYNLKFDRDYGLSGGEDTEFFYQMQQKGAKFYWEPKAKVVEFVPTKRLNLLWIIKRQFRYGNAYMRIEMLKQPQKRFFKQGFVSLIDVFRWFFLSLISVRKNVFVARMLRSVFSLGSLTAIMGYVYEEYA